MATIEFQQGIRIAGFQVRSIDSIGNTVAITVATRVETGELVDLHELDWSDYAYLGRYYSSRVGEDEHSHLFFYQEVRFVNHEEWWYGYLLSLPHIPSAEEREKERIKNEEQAKRNRRAKVVETIFFFRELIRLFFGG